MNPHSRLVTAGLVALVTCVTSATSPAEAQAEIEAELARLVAIVDPTKRDAAAIEFAKQTKHPLEDLRTAMLTFGVFAQVARGRSEVRVPLWTGKAEQQTELHIYVPKAYDPKKPSPLLLIGHWSGGNGKQALGTWIGLADRLGMLLLAPSETGANDGWGFTIRERESARSAVRYFRRHYNVDENRIYCTGVSRGGHMAWDLALRYPDQFAAIAPMIGGPRINLTRGQNNLRYIENVAHLPIRDLQGSKDDKYLVANLRFAFQRLEALEARDAKLIEFPQLGHSYDMNAVDWSEFFTASVREPIPDRVVRMMATKRETRAFWVHVAEKDRSRVKVVPRIPASRKVQAMDINEKREYVANAVERRTARLEVERLAKGRFLARAKLVRSFKILLDPSMFEPGKPVLVKYKARQRRMVVRTSKTVLCRDFADRFDRTFLPVAELTVR